MRLRRPSTSTARAAARDRNSTDRKPMRAGIWVKSFRAEAKWRNHRPDTVICWVSKTRLSPSELGIRLVKAYRWPRYPATKQPKKAQRRLGPNLCHSRRLSSSMDIGFLLEEMMWVHTNTAYIIGVHTKFCKGEQGGGRGCKRRNPLL